MRYHLGLIFLSVFLIQACAHQPHKKESSKDKAGKLKTEKLTEVAQNSQPGVPHLEANGSFIKSNSDLKIVESDRLYFELSGEKYQNLSENEIYEKIGEKYRANDGKALEAYVNLLISQYPDSRFADNSLYLQGMLAFASKAYGKSLSCFQKIIDQYPNGNKAVSALFAKGVLYKRMNLKPESEDVLRKVKNKFPGSPESLRAEAEVKILNQ